MLSPTYWLLAAVALGWLAGRPRWKRRWRWVAILIFIVFTNPLLFQTVMGHWEGKAERLNGNVYELAIVLGGYGEFNERGDRLELYAGADRLTEGMALYEQGAVNRLVISSGVHEDDHPEWKESIITQTFLERCGIPSEDVILESDSWNTYQNAIGCKAIMDSLGIRDEVLLITSAYHMRRASACFIKAGIPHRVYPVDYMTDLEPMGISDAIIPKVGLMSDWSILLKEWMGLMVYRMKGYL